LERENLPGARRVLFAIALLGVVFLASLAGIRPPAPKPRTAPANQFSAGRARDVLFQLVGDDLPHPIGSPQNDVVRQRIVDQFTRLGYEPQVQTAFDCDEYRACGTVRNVLARLEGRERGAVLLAAHYDSVPAGPGASDDGAGVAAVLEIARAMKAMPPPRHSVIFMIDDGEEAGLLGAHAFVDGHPWAKEVRAVVNIEARGSSGPSLMFETGSANEWTVRLFAQYASHPATNSIMYTAYKHLPNDTDMTVFKAAGYQGLNFAYLANVVHYHTPLDSFENANPASLQHHGDNALASVAALANADIEKPPEAEAVYFDIFGRWVARWPARRSPLVAILAFLLIAGQAYWLMRSGRLSTDELKRGLAAWIVVVIVTAAVSLIIVRGLRITGKLPVNWIAHPLALETGMWLLALTVVFWHSVVFARRAGFWGLWAGTWTWMSALAIVLSWAAPGTCYTPLVGASVAALAGLPFALHRGEYGQGSVMPVIAAIPVILPLIALGITAFELVLMLYASLGVAYLPAIAIVAAVLFAPLLPVCADLRYARGFGRVAILGMPAIATALAIFVASVVPVYSAKAPERVNIEYWLDADQGRGEWVVLPDSGRLPEAIRLAAVFHRTPTGLFPWERQPAFVADATHLGLAAPTFTILESSVVDGKHLYRMLLRSERAAPEAMVLFPPDSGIDSARMADFAVPAESDRVQHYLKGWTLYDCDTMPAKGVELSFKLPVGKPVEVYVIDKTFRLPDEGGFLLKSRPLTATRSQDGDIAVVSRRIQLIP
jgi:hypothetical protein